MNTNIGFEHTWRWFGPNDRITLDQIRQTGATGIVNALHHIAVGEVWSYKAIMERKNAIASHGLAWSVVESLPVSEDIKKQTGNYLQHIANYKLSMRNLAKAGVKTICYNFMPVLDWSRTNLNYQYEDGSYSLKYEYHKFAAFDLFILKRDEAFEEYPKEVIEKARLYFDTLRDEEKKELQNTILLGLPGSLEAYTLEAFQEALDSYKAINKEKLQEHLKFFLSEIVPVAEEEDIKLAIHPDDPPWALLGLPRIVTSYNDLLKIVSSVKSPNNGITLCTGSLGAGHFNNLAEIAKKLSSKVHFAHLRNVSRDENLDFMENNLFDGDVDIISVIETLMEESKKRNATIPMRPDHGFQILEDVGQENYPGYGLYGRMKSMAEIRGVELTLLKRG